MGIPSIEYTPKSGSVRDQLQILYENYNNVSFIQAVSRYSS